MHWIELVEQSNDTDLCVCATTVQIVDDCQSGPCISLMSHHSTYPISNSVEMQYVLCAVTANYGPSGACATL